MLLIKRLVLISILAASSSALALEKTPALDEYKRAPFYMGFGLGYGSTDWAPIGVATRLTLPGGIPDPLFFELPLSAKDSGLMGSVFMGYHFSKAFALETRYQSYGPSTIVFDPNASRSIPGSGLPPAYPELHGKTVVDSATQALAMVGKFFINLGQSKWSSYAEIGGALTFRQDVLARIYSFNPTFGAGLNYNFKPTLVGGLAFNYTGGKDKAVIDPAHYYIPFLYALEARISYHFPSKSEEPTRLGTKMTDGTIPPIKMTALDYYEKLPFYVGVGAGYGNVDWTPASITKSTPNYQFLALQLPIGSNTGGVLGSVFLGYHLSPGFALEARYNRFATSQIYFDSNEGVQIVYPQLRGRTKIATHTQAFALVGKYFINLWESPVSAYAELGGAYVFRQDDLANISRLTPTFGGGLDYNFASNLSAGFEFNYTAGFDKAVINPAHFYIPFLYAFEFRLTYHFSVRTVGDAW